MVIFDSTASKCFLSDSITIHIIANNKYDMLKIENIK